MKLAETWAGIKSHMCSNFGQSGLFTLELPALIAKKTIFDLLSMLDSGKRSLLRTNMQKFLLFTFIFQQHVTYFLTECNTPANPVHGSVSVSENSSVASYSCDVGYSISGTVERLCQTDGQGWSEAQPVCGKFDHLLCFVLEFTWKYIWASCNFSNLCRLSSIILQS